MRACEHLLGYVSVLFKGPRLDMIWVQLGHKPMWAHGVSMKEVTLRLASQVAKVRLLWRIILSPSVAWDRPGRAPGSGPT